MKVAIAGYAQEGEMNFAYWQKLGATLAIFDEKQPKYPLPEGVDVVIGPDAFRKLDGFDLVVRTASLNPRKIHTDGTVWSATNEFFAKCPAPIIGVTGTKGKGTTCSLITEILRAAGKTVHLVGNIGVPALQTLPRIKALDLVVFELSSFQLWDLKKSPETAVVLMVEPDHMDIHASMAEYVEAKAQIATHQKPADLLVYHPTNRYSAEVAATSLAQKKRYLTREGAYIQDNAIMIEENRICATHEVGLKGAHNIENICAAITAAWNYTQDTAAIKKAVTNFKGLPHRLEEVGSVKGVLYVNDSYASAPGATSAAIRSFTQPEVLICGGYDRGIRYDELAAAIAEQSNIKKVVLIGETRQKLAEALRNHSFNKTVILDSKQMSDVVKAATQEAAAGDVVLLSPGCPSFDMFNDFTDRGERFKSAVKELGS